MSVEYRHRIGGWRLRLAGGFLWLLPGLAVALCAEPAWSPGDVRGLTQSTVPAGSAGVLRGVVGARFLSDPGLDGFYVQANLSDGEPAGVFVYTPDREHGSVPERGRQVAVSGQTGRYRGRHQFERVADIADCGPGRLEPTPLALPLERERAERLAGVLVRAAPERGLVVTGNRDLFRYGSLELAIGDRLFHPRSGIAGGVPAGLILDDGAYRRDPQPVAHLNAEGTRRNGDRMEALVGVLAFAFDAWRLHPVKAVAFEEANPRPPPPQRAGGPRVVGYNLENWFATLGQRGAANSGERRQQAERLAALVRALGPDVLALQEIENRPRALAELIDLLDTADGAGGRYLAATAGLGAGSGVIRNAILYRADRLELEDAAVLEDRVHERPPLAASFRDAEGFTFGVATFHAKSKGGCRAGMPRLPDGGCWNERRVEQAQSLMQWRGALHRRFDHDRLLFIGDLNSQPRERPARVMLESDLVDLVAGHLPPRERYSYVYRGRAGLVDHALADPALASAVGGVHIWAVNADEPWQLPYEGGTPWRGSDHDPVIVDFSR